MELIINKVEILLEKNNEKKKIEYLFSKGINILYATNGYGKSTISESIMHSFGSNDFEDLEISLLHSKTSVMYRTGPNEQFKEHIFENSNKNIKKHNDFLKNSMGLRIDVPIKSSNYSHLLNISDLMNYFYCTQISDRVDQPKNKKYLPVAIESAQLYLYGNELSIEEQDLLNKNNEITKKINEIKQKIKIDHIFKNEYSVDRSVAKNFNDLMEKLDKLTKERNKTYYEKRKIENQIYIIENNENYRNQMKETFQKIKYKLPDNNEVCLWDILVDDLNFIINQYSVNDIIDLMNEKEEKANEINRINNAIKETKEQIDLLPIKEKFELSKEILKLMILENDENNDIIELTKQRNENNNKIKSIKEKIKTFLLEKEKIINKQIKKEFDIIKSNGGVGQQGYDLVKRTMYQKNFNFPIIFDGFLDSSDDNHKISFANFLISKLNGQGIFFYTIKNDDDVFIERMKSLAKEHNKKINLIHLKEKIFE